MNIGYARVSTDEQNLDLQRNALMQAGCESVFEDQVSGMAIRRPGLDQALARLGADDSLVVWRLDRLGRSLPHLIETIRLIGEKDAGFRSLRGCLGMIWQHHKTLIQRWIPCRYGCNPRYWSH